MLVCLKFENLSFSDKYQRPYDFYRDSNIAEILGSTEVLRKIETRTNEELELWPDHAVLIDVSNVFDFLFKDVNCFFSLSVIQY